MHKGWFSFFHYRHLIITSSTSVNICILGPAKGVAPKTALIPVRASFVVLFSLFFRNQHYKSYLGAAPLQSAAIIIIIIPRWTRVEPFLFHFSGIIIIIQEQSTMVIYRKQNMVDRCRIRMRDMNA